MKKVLFTVPVIFSFLSGCSSYNNIQVKWTQIGSDCVYTETYEYVSAQEKFDLIKFKSVTETTSYLKEKHTITYPDIKCSVVMNKEFEKETYKSGIPNQFHRINSLSNSTNITRNSSSSATLTSSSSTIERK